MLLRDAEPIILEAGKVPSLRRRGQVEAMAMPALEAQLLEEFAQPLLGSQELQTSYRSSATDLISHS